jgi:tRNA1(Val) A37 N6-methylase TrmN6
MMKTTTDRILGGTLSLEQPSNGYRAAIDPVFLAASVPLTGGEKVLDVGSGVGTAMLCLAKRMQNCTIYGLEKQKELVEIGQKNIHANSFQDRLTVIQGDLMTPPLLIKETAFDCIMTNPPYFEAFYTTSPHPVKSASNTESSVVLEDWIAFCSKRLRPGGVLSMIYRTDQVDKVLSFLYGKLGGIQIFPLWATATKPSKRVIIRAKKGARTGCFLHRGLTLHKKDQTYTQAAEKVLKQGRVLLF